MAQLKLLDFRLYSVLHCLLFIGDLKGQKLICTTEFIDANDFSSLMSGIMPNEQVRIILNAFVFNFCVYFCLQTGAVYMERKCPCSYT